MAQRCLCGSVKVVVGKNQFTCRDVGALLSSLFAPPSAGVWFVCLDRRPSASLGERPSTRGCHPRHDCHRLIHGVCQQHSHYYHLSACLGRAGKVVPWQDQLLLCSLALGWAGLCCVCAGTGTVRFSCSWAAGTLKSLEETKQVPAA